MPKPRRQQIKIILLRKIGYKDISPDDLAYAEEVEEKLQGFEDPAARDEYYKGVKERYEQISGLKKTESVSSVSELSASEKHENLGEALQMLSGIESKYEKMNPIGRFFSHFVPNSWTEAGRMRDEIKSCNAAMKEAGVGAKDVEDYYRQEWGKIDPDLRNEFIAARARANHWFNSGAEKELREYAKNNLIADPINLDETDLNPEKNGQQIDDDFEEDREPMEIDEAREEYEDIPESVNIDSQQPSLDGPTV